MKSNSSYMVWPATFLLTLTLSGCFGGGGSDRGGDSGRSPIDSDSFLSRVNAIIGNTSETAEPESIESIEVTTPENTETVPIS